MATVADFGEEKVVSLTPSQRTFRTGNRPRESVVQVMRELVADMVNGVRHGGGKQSWMEKAQREVQDKGPRLKTALGLSTADIVQWMHAGGPWRAFLVTAAGIISLIAVTGLTVFAAFLLTATANAVAIGLLMSTSAVGAFMAFFFSALTAIYVGALAASSIAISTVGFLSVCALLFFSGWIAVAWAGWQGVTKCLQFVRASLSMTGNALTTISSAGSTQIIAVEKRPGF